LTDTNHVRIYEVRAAAPRADEHTRVLKHGETFAVLDHFGDIATTSYGEEGIYHRDMRHLSCLSLTLNGAVPMLLSTTGIDDGTTRTEDFANLDYFDNGELVVPFGTLHLTRTKLLWERVCHERIILTGFGDQPVTAQLRIELGADFADIFEVRGTKYAERGTLHPVEVLANGLCFRYDGRDRRTRTTLIQATPRPDAIDERSVTYHFQIAPRESRAVEISYAFDATRAVPSFDHAAGALSASRAELNDSYCRINTSNEQFNEWLRRSVLDMQILVTQTEHGLYPYAGVPWFSTVFGRDGIIAALQTLWVNPDIARGVLRLLSAYQADEIDPERAAEPGKIVHELRSGELAELSIVPFGRYYGSADATPLFVHLAGEYFHTTGDLEFAAEIWPHVERALRWIEEYGDHDRDGFVEYGTTDTRGLTNQGWKDSWNSVFHADGSLAQGPIALVEVQAYVYAAYCSAARMAGHLGQPERAAELLRSAEALRDRFDADFWCDEIQTYALALDGDKRQCAVRTSNAGHALFAGVARPERAQSVVAQLLSGAGFSGWGMRTVSANEFLYNPMSYHNGSVWPHDNAMIACGLGRYGFGAEALKLLSGLFSASMSMDLRRLPELVCGFERRGGDGPTLYPLACTPQAWSSGAAFMLLNACLGMTIDAPKGELRLHRSRLPTYIDELVLRDLRIGRARVDVRLHRYEEDIGVNVTRREGDVDVVVVK
jgi:glycogen debranching enzyme